MPRSQVPHSTIRTGLLAALLAVGWGFLEAIAATVAAGVPCGTRNAAEIETDNQVFAGVSKGKAGLHAGDATPSLHRLQIGRSLLIPGQEPHPPQRDADEEVLIDTRGKGDVMVDGTATPVADGAVMDADPNVEHGIRNTGNRPLEFQWIKSLPQPS